MQSWYSRIKHAPVRSGTLLSESMAPFESMVPSAPFRGLVRAFAWRAAFALALTLGACDARPTFVPGDECELNTDCAAPLVCRLGRCRVECRAQRDCGARLECVRDELELGACQLPDETECELSSDCAASLVCHFGRCTNECESDRDCPPGAHCRNDEGVRGCRDESVMECTLTSECEPDLVCAVDRRCREPCRTDWDCSDERACLREGATAFCGWPSADGGGPDGGVPDGGVPDGGEGPMDGGMTMVPPPPPPTLTAGLRNTCAAPAGEAPHCWGDNLAGQIGDGTTVPRPVPTAIADITAASILDMGHDHACAATSSGVFCWGDNAEGQLGIGTTTPSFSSTPVAVVGLPPGTVRDLALGTTHSCAIVDDTLYCWGGGSDGQLGQGDTARRLVPSEVPLAAPPIDLDTFSSHTCATLVNGTVQCFGANGNGQVGDGGTLDALSPVTASGLTDAVGVATGGAHTCALRSDGVVLCWGSDTLGEAGNGGAIGDPNVLTPTPTRAIPEPVRQLSAGSAHTCARGASGVYCWGNNFSGESGRDKTSDATLFTPARVVGLGAVEEIAAGSEHTCARVGGTLHYCFGSNGAGQLGIGSVGGVSWTPVEVAWP